MWPHSIKSSPNFSAIDAKFLPVDSRSSTINPWLRLCLNWKRVSTLHLGKRYQTYEKIDLNLNPASELWGCHVWLAPSAASSTFHNFTIFHPTRNLNPLLCGKTTTLICLLWKCKQSNVFYLRFFILPQLQKLCKYGRNFLLLFRQCGTIFPMGFCGRVQRRCAQWGIVPLANRVYTTDSNVAHDFTGSRIYFFIKILTFIITSVQRRSVEVTQKMKKNVRTYNYILLCANVLSKQFGNIMQRVMDHRSAKSTKKGSLSFDWLRCKGTMNLII